MHRFMDHLPDGWRKGEKSCRASDAYLLVCEGDLLDCERVDLVCDLRRPYLFLNVKMSLELFFDVLHFSTYTGLGLTYDDIMKDPANSWPRICVHFHEELYRFYENFNVEDEDNEERIAYARAVMPRVSRQKAFLNGKADCGIVVSVNDPNKSTTNAY